MEYLLRAPFTVNKLPDQFHIRNVTRSHANTCAISKGVEPRN